MPVWIKTDENVTRDAAIALAKVGHDVETAVADADSHRQRTTESPSFDRRSPAGFGWWTP